jgi:hypothetical protein
MAEVAARRPGGLSAAARADPSSKRETPPAAAPPSPPSSRTPAREPAAVAAPRFVTVRTEPKPEADASPPAAVPPPPRATERPKPAAPARGASRSAPTRRARPRTPAPEVAAICQIHWLGKGRGSCFAAVTFDAQGGRHSLATSRRVEWRGSLPPTETPESQAAVRQLSRILRDNGWQPIRGNGEDLGEERWYARRFRRTAASEGAGTDPS